MSSRSPNKSSSGFGVPVLTPTNQKNSQLLNQIITNTYYTNSRQHISNLNQKPNTNIVPYKKEKIKKHRQQTSTDIYATVSALRPPPIPDTNFRQQPFQDSDQLNSKIYQSSKESCQSFQMREALSVERRAANGNYISFACGPLRRPRYINEKIEQELVEFKLEIEGKFSKSFVNKNFKFPRIESLSIVDSSQISLVNQKDNSVRVGWVNNEITASQDEVIVTTGSQEQIKIVPEKKNTPQDQILQQNFEQKPKNLQMYLSTNLKNSSARQNEKNSITVSPKSQQNSKQGMISSNKLTNNYQELAQTDIGQIVQDLFKPNNQSQMLIKNEQYKSIPSNNLKNSQINPSIETPTNLYQSQKQTYRPQSGAISQGQNSQSQSRNRTQINTQRKITNNMTFDLRNAISNGLGINSLLNSGLQSSKNGNQQYFTADSQNNNNRVGQRTTTSKGDRYKESKKKSIQFYPQRNESSSKGRDSQMLLKSMHIEQNNNNAYLRNSLINNQLSAKNTDSMIKFNSQTNSLANTAVKRKGSRIKPATYVSQRSHERGDIYKSLVVNTNNYASVLDSATNISRNINQITKQGSGAPLSTKNLKQHQRTKTSFLQTLLTNPISGGSQNLGVNLGISSSIIQNNNSNVMKTFDYRQVQASNNFSNATVQLTGQLTQLNQGIQNLKVSRNQPVSTQNKVGKPMVNQDLKQAIKTSNQKINGHSSTRNSQALTFSNFNSVAQQKQYNSNLITNRTMTANPYSQNNRNMYVHQIPGGDEKGTLNKRLSSGLSNYHTGGTIVGQQSNVQKQGQVKKKSGNSHQPLQRLFSPSMKKQETGDLQNNYVSNL